MCQESCLQSAAACAQLQAVGFAVNHGRDGSALKDNGSSSLQDSWWGFSQ